MSLRKILLPALIAITLIVSGCGGDKKASTNTDPAISSVSDAGNAGLDFAVNADSDSGKAGPLQTVLFPFNSAEITGDTKATLDNNISFLKEQSAVEIQIEGHCDERGGIQYNIALGEKRANSVKDYYVSMGISSSRLTTISFGKERPVSFGHGESSWGENRRANFVVTAK